MCVCAIPTPSTQVNPNPSSTLLFPLSVVLTKLISFIPIIGNHHYATTSKTGNNKYGKYATNHELDHDIEEVEDDQGLQITPKLKLTAKFETTPISSAWVGPSETFIHKTSYEKIENGTEKQYNQFDKGYGSKLELSPHYYILMD